jgi:ribose transport system substrate-binding protein
MSRFALSALALVCVVSLAGCPSSASNSNSTSTEAKSGQPTFAFVTNCVADFWTVAEKGVEKAKQDLGVNAVVVMPNGDAVDQKNKVEDLIARGVDGIAISPKDPTNQGDMLKAISENALFITHDSDAPNSPRLCYIGMDNYQAGRLCGELIKEAKPDGAQICLFIGNIDQDNSKKRRQGLIDELLDRPADPVRFDPAVGVIKNDKYTILDTRTDNHDSAKAKELVQDAMSKYPEMDLVVGLFEYNPPILLDAVKGANLLKEITVVAFDENAQVLQGIKDGEVFGTVVQNPYDYGYKSIELLNEIYKGNKAAIPASGMIDIPARKITKANVNEFWTDLKAKIGK